MNLQELIPQHKHDVTRVENLIASGYPAVVPILPELVEWLQDMNWPVAQAIAPFLVTIGLPLVPFIREVLNSRDEMWKYWVLSQLVGESREIFDALEEKVRRMASKDEGESVREMAHEILNQFSRNPVA